MLAGRMPITDNIPEMRGRVLLTGGSGFLGRGILRRAHAENWPCEFIVYSRDEHKQAMCKRKYKDVHYVIGDIRDVDRLRLTMLGCETVIHTAAFKYVPEAELNVSEAISINVDGTKAVLMAAYLAGTVNNVVSISTDKAVRPVNVYGMSKALAERLVAEMSAYDTLKCTGVRYGNVVGSTGSIVPELIAQAQTNDSVNMTNPKMTRFWISIDEAINLILTALSQWVLNGSIIIPDPRAMDLASLFRAVLPNTPINVVGERPGEKLHEELLTEAESAWVRTIQLSGSDEGDSGYELLALGNRFNPHLETFSLSSEHAIRMTESNFMDIVTDSYQV